MSDSNSTKPYNPVGYCIYCGASGPEVPLEREHIVPLGLRGILVLPNASCRSCATITGNIEQECLRKILGDLRTWRGIRGRKRKKKDKYKPRPMLVQVGGKLKEYDAPESEKRLDVAALYAFHMPAIITGISPPSHPAVWAAAALGKKAREAALEQGPDSARVYAVASFHPELFAKMLAKIGHSFAVAEASGRFEPVLGRAIVGKEPWRPGYFVGGEPEWWPASEYDKELGLLRMTGTDKKEYCVARIRLFGDQGAPIYYVVVGEATA